MVIFGLGVLYIVLHFFGGQGYSQSLK